jgi:poly(A) polymerase
VTPKRRKLRPSQDVVQRIRWDPRFQPSAYWIVFRERGGGEAEEPLPTFLASGRVPWSRVIRVRDRDGIAVWDRERRLDRLFGSGETSPDDLVGEVRAEVVRPRAQDAFLIPLAPWRYESGAWRPASEVPDVAPGERLRVLTWNVLFDRFKPEAIHTARRMPVLLDLLERADADLIGLQEVTPSFLQALLETRWARGYWLSEGPSAATVSPSGQLLLSRLPLRALGVHPFSTHKQAVVAEIGDSLTVAVVHLTSNMTPNAPRVRAQQLRTLRGYLQRTHAERDWLVLGDFNQGEDEPDGGLAKAGAHDAWRTLFPGEAGHTFAPSENGLAELMSSTGRGARFDRLLVRSLQDRWSPAGAELVGREAIAPGLWPSDHFGLSVDLAASDGLGAAPVHTSSLALLPPPAMWPPLQTLRRAHDRGFRRWPPHVNLLYGFIPEERFPAAVARLRTLLSDARPLDLELERLDHFRHRRHTTLWADPQPHQPVAELQARLQAVFTQCDEHASKSATDFIPHLSLGTIPTRSQPQVAAALGAWSSELGVARSGALAQGVVDAVFLLARSGRRPFRVRHAIPLGSPRSLRETLAATGLESTPAQVAAREAALEVVRAAVDCEVVVGGSVALDVALAPSDLDLGLRLGERDPDAVLGALAAVFGGRLVGSGSRQTLRFEMGAVSVDAQPATANPLLSRWVALEDPQAAREALRALKAWAHLRRVDRQAFGFLGGAAWASALTQRAETRAGASSEELLVATLEGLATAAPPDLGDPALTRVLTPGTWSHLLAELRAALPLAQAALDGLGAWSGLFVPAPPPAPPLVWVEVSAPDPQAWIAARALGLQRFLEGAGLSPQPDPRPEPWEAGLRWAWQVERAPDVSAIQAHLGSSARVWVDP